MTNTEQEQLDALQRKLFERFTCDQKTVYHYTSQAGLLGILQSRAIRAHSTMHANDPSEGTLVQRAVGRLTKRDENTLAALKSIDVALPTEAFCTSFSLEDDLLSQWRGYAAGGAGFAIGFRSEEFESKRVTVSGCVLYSDNEQDKLVAKTVLEHARFLPDGRTVEASLAAETNRRVATSFTTCLLAYNSMMKDNAYHEEREYRHVILATRAQVHEEKIDFVVSSRGISPYVSMPITTHCVKEIVVGPCLPFEETRHAVSLLLERTGYKDVHIRASRIPHRS